MLPPLLAPGAAYPYALNDSAGRSEIMSDHETPDTSDNWGSGQPLLRLAREVKLEMAAGVHVLGG